MGNQNQTFDEILKMLDDSSALKHVVLIGSWSQFIYQEAEILPKDLSRLATLDLDFLVKNLNKPTPPINLITLAKENGLAVEVDRMTNVTKIRTSSRLEIEFLISKRGGGIQQVYDTSLGVVAQGLRNMEILLNNTVDVNYKGIVVTVPIPEAYILHKIIINEERSSQKKEKDTFAIKTLYPFLNKSKLKNLVDELTKKQLKRFNSYRKQHEEDFI